MEPKVIKEGNKFCVQTQEFSTRPLPDTCINRQMMVVFFRLLVDEQGKPLWTLQELAAIVDSTNRQAASQHVEDFRACGEDFQAFSTRKRKVHARVVECVQREVEKRPLAGLRELAERVNDELGRKDMTESNIKAALEQIPYLAVRGRLLEQLQQGAAHYQEAYLLEEAFEALKGEHRNERKEVISVLKQAKVEPSTREGMKVPTPSEAIVSALCTADTPVQQIPLAVRWVVFCLALYGYGVPLRVLGQWLAVDKTSVLRWILGLAVALYDRIYAQMLDRVKANLVYLDEKWVKIRGRWYYWFVALDGQTELPLVHGLLARRSGWNCLWILLKLKQAGLPVRVFVTDKLKGYFWAIPRVFGAAVHQLCLFHHQQNVTEFVRERFPDERQQASRKVEMKKVFQTTDPPQAKGPLRRDGFAEANKRTVRNRLAKLQAKEQEQGLGIAEWLKQVIDLLPHLLPAIGSRRIPTTNNAMERFFRSFTRFYKVRKGFYSVASAKRQLIVFLVFYVFTQGQDGCARIERILPEARRMPLYQLMNDPFGCLGLGRGEVETSQPIAQDVA